MAQPFSTRRLDLASSSAARSEFESLPSSDFAERLHRWAVLVAVGETPLPADLKPAELKSLLGEVARLRRERLVRSIARAIAQDIHSGREP
jgi:hypothetical protein